MYVQNLCQLIYLVECWCFKPAFQGTNVRSAGNEAKRLLAEAAGFPDRLEGISKAILVGFCAYHPPD